MEPLAAQRPRQTLKDLAEFLRGQGADGQGAKVHEVWSYPHFGGRSRFFCNGRCVTGPPGADCKFKCVTYGGISLPTAFFFSVCAPALWTLNPVIPLCAGVLLALTIILLLLTSYTDPGIIPRPALQILFPGLQKEVAEMNGLKGRPGGRLSDVISVRPDPAIIAELEGEGYWWCRWCHMIQPPRAKHCRDCDCCVREEDHHCPFLNTCIGQRNYCYFNFFVCVLSLYGIYVVCSIFVWMADFGGWLCLRNLAHCAAKDSAMPSPEAAILAVLVTGVPSLLILALLLFSIFHCFLIITGRTTREVLTGRFTLGRTTSFCSARRAKSSIHAMDFIPINRL